ncbi:MAG: RCC1 domain-containing protein [Planctomycetota bacterium]|jgi:hypothetical protein
MRVFLGTLTFIVILAAVHGCGDDGQVMLPAPEVWTWGDNDYWQLGSDSRLYEPTPVQVLGPGGSGFLTDVQAIAAGWKHTVALGTDGSVWAWGHNDRGQLGDGTRTSRATPVQVVGPGGTGVLTGIQQIAAGYLHTVALKADGTVWAWGRNDCGQLGDGTTTNTETPVQVVGQGGGRLPRERTEHFIGKEPHRCFED